MPLQLMVDADLLKAAKDVIESRGGDIAEYLALQLRALTRSKMNLKLSDVMPFGKYGGAQVRQILSGDPHYMRWALENMSAVTFDQEVHDAFDALLGQNNDRDLDGEIPFDQ